MSSLLHDIVHEAARRAPDATALVDRQKRMSYEQLDQEIRQLARGLSAIGFKEQQRLAIFLPKRSETVVSMFATTAAGGVFVPINPVLKAPQVAHVINDCGASVLVTSRDRLAALREECDHCSSINFVIILESEVAETDTLGKASIKSWSTLMASTPSRPASRIDVDVASIFYTSGSTGKPKGVVLSHRNLVEGAKSVSTYLNNTPSDRILSALPLSFDAGFSQITTAFYARATLVLHDFFLPRDIVKVSEREEITGITAVPPLWAQIAEQKWPDAARNQVRYFANTGGKMPRRLLMQLRDLFPNAEPFLMYGLTEAFRSTYLPPEEVDNRPDSIGRAIPNAEILVVREDGSICDDDEPGELVHRGALVALGYWNAPEATALRFKANPAADPHIPTTENSVWSGDIVRRDSEGYLYFVGRKDDMIKTSGYRVSPTEVEEVGFESGLVNSIAAIGVEDERLGQRIVVVAAAQPGSERDTEALMGHYRACLPTFMVPSKVEWRDELPRSPNGKIDRPALAAQLANDCQEQSQ